MAEKSEVSPSPSSGTPAAIEQVLSPGKPPWRPKVAGYNALLLGPMAGALVAAVSLRRMGKTEKAQRVLVYSALLCLAFLIPFLRGIPPGAPMKKIILIAVEGAGFSVFPSLLREDYTDWRTAHLDIKQRNDYASVGWGLLGLVVYILMGVLILVVHR